jgi:hypothetical protein
MPNATVEASGHGSDSAAPFDQAETIGAQPSACTATSRGIRSAAIQPSARSSFSAFQIPISPTPPPVG